MIASSTPVTVWLRWQPPVKETPKSKFIPGYWGFNHIEDGHSATDIPADKFGRNWKSAAWRKAHGVLESGSPKSIHGGPVLEWEPGSLYDTDGLTASGVATQPIPGAR